MSDCKFKGNYKDCVLPSQFNYRFTELAHIHQTTKRRAPRKALLVGLAIVLLGLAVGGWLLYRHDELQYRQVLVLGHAGSGFLSPLNPFNPLPPNSKGSLVQAMELGADGLEVDVQLSKDGVPVLYHDVTLASMTVRQEPDTIENLNAKEVVGLAYKGGAPYDLFHEEKIITLEELLQLLGSYEQAPYLHIDLRNHDPQRYAYYAQTLLALLRKYNYPLQRLVFISPDPSFLLAFRQEEPAAQLMLDAGGDFEQAQAQALKYNLNGICANGRDASAALVAQAKQQGLQVALFGGKSRSRIARMINMGPDAIQVNNVAAMRAMLD